MENSLSPRKSSWTIAHLSDLHIGQSAEHLIAARSLRDVLEQQPVDQILISGDITHHGRHAEFALFQETFANLISQGKVVLVPGNHDRLHEGAWSRMMEGKRMDTIRQGNILLIRIDTSGPHNRLHFISHGMLDHRIFDELEEILATVRPTDFVITMLHHHLLPLPGDNRLERVLNWMRWPPFCIELVEGSRLIRQLHGRSHLMLHGHRHTPWEKTLAGVGRDLPIYNAGSSTELNRFRVFEISEAGILSPPVWRNGAALIEQK